MDWLPVEVSSAPASEPLTAAEARAALNIDGTDHDTLLTSLLLAAREQVEAECGIALITQTHKYRASLLCGSYFVLPRAPVSAITSITYTDTNGDTQTLSTSVYRSALYGLSPRVELAYGQSWPSQREQVGGVVVTATAGYGAASAVPQPIKQAMLLMVGEWFANRENTNVGNITSEMPLSSKYLLANYRRFVM